MRALLLIAASSLALPACSPDAGARQDYPPQSPPEETRVEETAGDMAEPDIQRVDAEGQSATFENAWIRTPPRGRDIAAGYVTIATAEPDAILRVRSEAAERVALHTMTVEDDVMRMRRTGRIETGPEGATLEPGGDHLMIFGLSETARLSGTVDLTFYFESGLTAENIEFQIASDMPGVTDETGEAEPY